MRNALRIVALGAAGMAAWATSTAPAVGANWTTHRDPAGYIIDVPPGWNLSYEAQRHMVTLSARDGVRVIVRVVTTKQALTQDEGTAIGEDIAQKTDAGIRWSAGVVAAPAIAVIGSQDGSRVGKTYFVWRSSPSLSVGYFYAATGARDALVRDQSAVTRVFQSYRLAAPPAAVAAAAGAKPVAPLQYVRFTEPNERMFTVELPAGWNQTGNINRQSILDFRPAFRASEPGRIVIQSGDGTIPFFELPNQMLAMGGIREGSWYQAGPGARLMVRRFTDGTSFARQYAAVHFGSSCTNLQVADARSRQDAVAALNATFAEYGLPAQISAGEVAFTCTLDGHAMRGYIFAATKLQALNGSGIWNVQLLLAYFATPELSAQAHAALEHAVATYQVDPAWARRNADSAKSISEITTRTGHEISHIISDTYWSTSESRSAALANYDVKAVRGHQLATDPVTHTTMEIDDRYAYNFIDHSGNIVGSDVNAAPGAEFRRLITNP